MKTPNGVIIIRKSQDRKHNGLEYEDTKWGNHNP